MQQSLSLATLGSLNGGSAELIVDAAIRDAVADLDDRGGDELPRKVLIELEMKVLDNDLIDVHVTAIARLPKRRTPSTFGRVTRNSKNQSRLTFQTEAPDNPDQRTIDELETERK